MPTYTGIYKAGKRGKGKTQIKVYSLDPLPPTRDFQTSGSNLKPFKLVKQTKTHRKVIVMAATKTKKEKAPAKSTKSRKKATDEVEDIEGVEELEAELEETDEEDVEDEEVTDDEDADEEDEDDDEDEDVETPKSKKGKKKKGKKASRASANGKVGTAEVAAHCDVDARTLRMVLRKHAIPKDEETGRYEWEDLDDPTVKKIKKLIDKGEAADIKKESLDKLKAKKEAEKAANGGKKKKKNKKNKKKKEEEDDE